jgi:DNA-binding MarR family transcriptional regulator
MRLLLAVDHALDGRSKRMHARFGITAPQRLVLRIVGRFPDISAGEVAAIMETHPSTITGVLRRLEQRGWIERRFDRGDRRRSLLRLTAAGRRYDRLRSGTVEHAVRRALGRIDARDAAATERVLRLVARELEEAD